MSKQLIAEGTEVQIQGAVGAFTVLKQTLEKPNPLYCEYEVMNKRGEKFVVEVADMHPIMGQSFSIEWQESYDIACPHCEHLMECEPSEFHKLGFLSMGSGCCSKCDEVFAIHFNPFANRMIARMEF